MARYHYFEGQHVPFVIHERRDDDGDGPYGIRVAIVYTEDAAKLVVKALNRLPETENDLRNERLRVRREANSSPDAETA